MKRDVLTFRDGENRDAAALAMFCGGSNSSSPPSSSSSDPIVVMSSGQTALLEFVSDATHERQGFAATLQFVAADKLPPAASTTDVPDPHLAAAGKPSPATFGNFFCLSFCCGSFVDTFDNGDVYSPSTAADTNILKGGRDGRQCISPVVFYQISQMHATN